MNRRLQVWLAFIIVGVAFVFVAVIASCGASTVTGGNGNDGRKTRYDNVRLQKIVLTADEGGGYVLCVSDYHSGIGIDCDWSHVGNR